MAGGKKSEAILKNLRIFQRFMGERISRYDGRFWRNLLYIRDK